MIRQTNSITALISCLLITTFIILFAGHFGLGVTASEDFFDTLASPSVWDVATYVGGTFFALLSLSESGWPTLLGYALWVLTAIELIAIVYLVRGSS